jgi:hypothetical protein
MPRGNGGIIGPANIPTQSSAKGVWSLSELTLAVRQSIWPLPNLGSDPYFEYTTLLLPGNGTNGAQNNTFLDGSTNNFTITRNGNTTQGTFSPFSQTGWGNYFDGAGDYLTLASNAAFSFGTGSFTYETWFYSTGTTSAANVFYDLSNANGAGSFAIFTTGGVLYIRIGGTGNDLTYTLTSSWTNTWHHLAVVRNGTTLTIYLDGTSVATGTRAQDVTQSTPYIGDSINALAGYSFGGYLSNTRVVKGTAVYTGNFTPPTSQLTAISGTSLLTCQSNRFIDNSTNNFTITRSGDTRVVAFSPFNPTASWSAATYGGSGYFDGTGDSLSGSFSLTTSTQNTFSFEGWLYPLSASSAIIIGDIQPTGTSAVLYITLSASRNLEFSWYDGATKTATSTATLNLNQWNFFAVVVNAGAISIYVNSTTPGQTGTTTLTNRAASTTFGLGAYFNSAYLNGYVGSLRVSTSARTISAIPTEPYTSDANTKLLLNFTNAGIYDATSKNDLETVGNAQISTTQSKWGGSSISFDGTGDWLLIPDQPPQRIGTGNFTVEMWVYRNSSGTYGLAGKGTGTTGWLVSLNSSNQVVFTYGSSTITSSGTVSATTWTHIAVVREGTSTNQTKIYISGTNDGTGTVSTDFNQTNSMYIGADRTGGSAANAYVQDVRITNYARYTANFTAPTASFPTL